MPHKLLLADDSVTIQRVIELTFADEDVQVIAVGDGKQAIEQVQRERPDIVLADVGMPERDGYEVAAFIKGTSELAHIPVLLLTGAFEPIDEARAKSVGCDGVLVKPFEPQMVISRVKDLLSGRKPVSLWAKTPAPAAQPPVRQPAQQVDLKGPAGAEPPAAPQGSLEDYFDRLDAAFATLDGGQPAMAEKPSATAAPPVAPPAPDRPQGDFDRTLRPSPASPLGDDLAGWDPDLAGDPERPVPVEPPPPEIAPATAAYGMQTPAAHLESPAPSPVTPPAPSAATPPAPSPVSPPVPSAAAPPEATPEPAPASAAASSPPAQTGPMPSLAEAFAALLAAEQGQHFSAAITPPQPVPDRTVDEIVRRVIARMSDQVVRQSVVDVAERLVREEIARIKGSGNP